MVAVTGSDDGLVVSETKVTSLVSVDELKEIYLTGLNITDPSNGEPLPDSTYQTYINNAVSMLEHYLDISITPVRGHEEFKDYHLNDYWDWGYLTLNNYPAICVNKLELVYLWDANGVPETLTEIPLEWIRLQRQDGIIRLSPNNRYPANLQVGATGAFFPEVLRTSLAPHLWRINYDFGFEEGKIPNLVNMAVSHIAAIQALIVGGNLVLGAGIAGSSISLDGLSQSIQTTQSAENSAFSATLKEYSDRLFGRRENDPFAMLPLLRNYYKGADFNILA